MHQSFADWECLGATEICTWVSFLQGLGQVQWYNRKKGEQTLEWEIYIPFRWIFHMYTQTFLLVEALIQYFWKCIGIQCFLNFSKVKYPKAKGSAYWPGWGWGKWGLESELNLPAASWHFFFHLMFIIHGYSALDIIIYINYFYTKLCFKLLSIFFTSFPPFKSLSKIDL